MFNNFEFFFAALGGMCGGDSEAKALLMMNAAANDEMGSETSPTHEAHLLH